MSGHSFSANQFSTKANCAQNKQGLVCVRSVPPLQIVFRHASILFFLDWPFPGRVVCFVVFQSARWRGSSFGFSLLMGALPKRVAGTTSAPFADAFDLFIDHRILRTFCPNRVVARRCRPRRYGAVNAPSYPSAGRISRRSDGCRTHRGATGGGR
jgi:hypothetical protein